MGTHPPILSDHAGVVKGPNTASEAPCMRTFFLVSQQPPSGIHAHFFGEKPKKNRRIIFHPSGMKVGVSGSIHF